MTLDELRKIAEAATPGPWHSPGLGEIHDVSHFLIVDVQFNDGSGDDSVGNGKQEDADFIATFNPQMIHKLLAVVEIAACLRPRHIALDKVIGALENNDG